MQAIFSSTSFIVNYWRLFCVVLAQKWANIGDAYMAVKSSDSRFAVIVIEDSNKQIFTSLPESAVIWAWFSLGSRRS